jgi:hypothetical protein
VHHQIYKRNLILIADDATIHIECSSTKKCNILMEEIQQLIDSETQIK